MEKIEKHLRTLLVRIIVSVVSFAIFVALATAVAIGDAEEMKLWVVAPLILSVLILPRQTMPSDIAPRELDDATRDRLDRTRKWLTWTRLAYLALAAVVMLVLPEVL